MTERYFALFGQSQDMEFCETCGERRELLKETGGWGTEVKQSEFIRQYLSCGHQQIIKHYPEGGRRIVPLVAPVREIPE